MTLRMVNGKLREVSGHMWARVKAREELKERIRNNRAINEIERLIETDAVVERERVGELGHYMIPAGPPSGDGRVSYRIFRPEDSEPVATIRGREAADRAVHELIEKGSITR